MLQNVLWLILILVLIFAIAFLVIAPLHDESYNKLRGYCKREPGFHCVKVSHRAQTANYSDHSCGEGKKKSDPILVLNDEINPTLHLQRGREYIFWLCDFQKECEDEQPTNEEDRMVFETMKLGEEDKEHLESICSYRDKDCYLLSIKPTCKTPSQFCYGTKDFTRIGKVFLFD